MPTLAVLLVLGGLVYYLTLGGGAAQPRPEEASEAASGAPKLAVAIIQPGESPAEFAAMPASGLINRGYNPFTAATTSGSTDAEKQTDLSPRDVAPSADDPSGGTEPLTGLAPDQNEPSTVRPTSIPRPTATPTVKPSKTTTKATAKPTRTTVKTTTRSTSDKTVRSTSRQTTASDSAVRTTRQTTTKAKPALTPRPTATPKPTSRPTATPKPTPRVTATPKPTPRQSSASEPVDHSSATPTRQATPRPTVTATDATEPTVKPTPAPTATSDRGPTMEERAEIVALARAQIGKPYVYAVMNPSIGFDCTGLTGYIYKKLFGVTLGRSAPAQSHDGIRVSPSNALPGDIICFDWKRDGVCDHVALFIGNGQYIDASHSAGRVRLKSFSWSKVPDLSVRRIIVH